MSVKEIEREAERDPLNRLPRKIMTDHLPALEKHELVLAEVIAMERWFEERQRLLKEFNMRAFGVRVSPLCSVWGVSEGIMGRGWIGSGSQMWAVRSPLLFRFSDGELLCCRHKFRQTTGVDWYIVWYSVCVCVELHIISVHD